MPEDLRPDRGVEPPDSDALLLLRPGVAATIHLSLSNMRNEWVEINAVPLEAFFTQPALRPERGYVTLPDRPGLGIEIDEDMVKKFSLSSAQ